MKRAIAKNEKEIEEYRQRLFKAKEAYRKEQAKLPFEKKIAIVMMLNRFAREWGAGWRSGNP
ncbi:MAG: hypothetical protein HUU32_02535 [Calditrichaceae bacterium]|nr:hypothetical protein [Calditrichia bacterium]NUQ40255.1 hypothetical protein [Calditrichaceae bacterium]